jgi:isoleucyl-tRNA synthetase
MKFPQFTPNYPEMERELLARWQKEDTFGQLVQQNAGGEPWSFFDGPITANNPMGVHHGWGRTYKDIYQRYHAMKGYDQRYQNGFDCHGLWVEVEVEKELGFKTKQDIENFGLNEFSRACRDRVVRCADRITEQSKRLGQWMDWTNSYYTMSPVNIKHIWHFLAKCEKLDLLYEGDKVMPWCCRCGTSLSHHEMADSYQDINGPSLYFTVKLKNDNDFVPQHFMVWTTTPWTVPANRAVAVHPDAIYSLVKLADKLIWMSQKAKETLYPDTPVLDQHPGIDFVGQEYEPPFPQGSLPYKIIPWNDVDESEGTGAVHIAPGCGEADYELGKKHSLFVLVPLDDNGKYLPGFAPWLDGLYFTKASNAVVDHITKSDHFVSLGAHRHRYPHCWRCKSPLAFRLVKEWFLRTEPIRHRLKAVAADMDWQPAYAGTQMQNWLDSMGDWCISRRRFWGLPLPIWKCENGHTHVMELDVGSDPHHMTNYHRPTVDTFELACKTCGRASHRIQAVGDCWLDAGIVPYSTLDYMTNKGKWGKWFPGEVVVEMREQVRLWFYSTLFMSVVLENNAPFKKVITYDVMLDEKGEQFSKTKANNLVFDDMADKLGSDPMRWVYAQASMTMPFRFGVNMVKDATRRLLTLWNCYKFMADYAELHDPDVSKPEMLTHSDQWLCARLNQVVDQTTTALDAYDTRAAAEALQTWIDDISYYIRVNRQRFVSGEGAAFCCLYWALHCTCRILAPILPFTAEQLWLNLGCKGSVHLAKWPDRVPASLVAEEARTLAEVALVREIITKAHALREAAGIKVRQPLASISVNADCDTIEKYKAEILAELNVKEIRYHTYATDVMLDIEITPALKQEGVQREVIRKLQDLRKKQGLKPGDPVTIWCTVPVDQMAVKDKCWGVEFYAALPPAEAAITQYEDTTIGFTR